MTVYRCCSGVYAVSVSDHAARYYRQVVQTRRSVFRMTQLLLAVFMWYL